MSSEMKKKFTKEEKLAIIKEASTGGVVKTLEKYGVYSATFYGWKKKFDQMGEAGLKHGFTVEKLKEIRRLEQENELLKQLLAEKEMESQLKDELLKKKYPWARKKYS